MSETPRTDAAKIETWCGCMVDHVPADFARELERELAVVRAALKQFVDIADAEPFTTVGHAVEHVVTSARATCAAGGRK